jgi:type II secretory pathway pseudopilin PulG
VTYALTLGLVLGLGVLAVLVLNTLMQQQARTIAAQQAALGALGLRQQTLSLQLDAIDNPRELSRRARALHMRPAGMLTPLRAPARGSANSYGKRSQPAKVDPTVPLRLAGKL